MTSHLMGRRGASERNAFEAGARPVGESNESGAGLLLDLLFEDPHVGRCLLAPNGIVLRSSRTWRRSTGLEREDPSGADVARLLADTPDEALEMLARARAGRVEVPRRVGRIDGREWWWAGTIDPVPMDGGTGLLITAREVAPDPGRQEAELDPRASEARFRTLAEESPVILWARDAHGVPEFVNRAFRDFYGVTLEEVEGAEWRPPVHPDDAATFEEAALTARRERKLFKAEARVRRADGEWRWIAAWGRPRFGETGEYLGHVGVSVDVTGRKRAEEALRLSEKKLRVSVANSAIGFALTTPDGSYLEANPAYCGITGYGIEELRGMTQRQLVHPDDLAANQRHIDRMLAGEISDFVIENRYRRKGGEDVWVRKSISVIRDGAGEPEWMIALVEDVTERKQAERTLQGTLQRFYGVLSSAYTAILLVTNEGRIEFANPALCKLLGLKEPRDLVGLSSSEMFERIGRAYAHPDEAVGRIKEIIRRGRPVRGEEVTLANGRTSLRDYVPLAVNGEPWGRLWLHFDITERKRAEVALRESEERYRSLFDHMSEGLAYCRMLFDGDRPADFVYLDVNPAFEALTGLSGVAGRKVSQVIPGIRESDPALLEAYGRVARLGATERFETHLKSLGQWFDISVYSPAPGDFVAVFDNITERKRAEEALRASEERMRLAQGVLREADRQKNQFLATLSHELRNPLTPIRNSLYILDRAEPGTDQARKAQAVIHRQIAQMTWLIDDLLDITRISHGKVQLRRERLDLNELAHRTSEDHRTAFVKGDVRLEVLPARAEVWVDGDQVRLAQTLGNLLQNAVKFTPRGGRVTVSIASAPASAQAILTVRDTGAGIEPEMLPRLFQPFAQADATLDRSKGGLGLGLALVKGLVELHGGSVSAASGGRGKGAAFTIRLPLDVTCVRTTTVERPAGGDGEPRRVLVIEDNEDAAETLRVLLELDGHVVEVADDGLDGIAKARAFRPDVVLCDIGLPELDGYAVARTMRADPELRRIGLVALSGYAQPEDVAAASAAGFEVHLAKPPSLEELERAVAEVGRGPPRSAR
jgi:PAS domain S-box-containing protein